MSLSDKQVDGIADEREVHSERYEMHTMSSATEIAHNVWLGPTPDASLTAPSDPDAALPSEAQAYDLFVEATDPAQLPDKKAFGLMESLLESLTRSLKKGWTELSTIVACLGEEGLREKRT